MEENNPTATLRKSKTANSLPAIRLSNLPEKELHAVLDNAIQCYGDGASIYAIALDLGIEHTTLYRQLLKHREGEWKDAKVSRAIADLEEAEQNLKTAPDALALSRAREVCRAAQWHLERLKRSLYGQEAQAGLGSAVQININLRGAAQTAENPLESE